MINQTIIFLIFEVLFIILFSWDVIRPNYLSEISNKGKKLIEKHLKQEDSLTREGDFSEFLRYYNMLEELTISYANELINVPGKVLASMPVWEQKRYRPKIMDSLKILNSNEIFNGRLLDEINELRQYRNFTVHGTDFSVNANIVERIKEIYNALYNVYSVHEDVEKRKEAISKLYEISNQAFKMGDK